MTRKQITLRAVTLPEGGVRRGFEIKEDDKIVFVIAPANGIDWTDQEYDELTKSIKNILSASTVILGGVSQKKIREWRKTGRRAIDV